MGFNSDNCVWLSIGENCLTIDILRRLELNSPSTLYSSGRSNIIHLIGLEEIDYKGVLSLKNITRGLTYGEKEVSLSTMISDNSGVFQQGPNEMIEFTNIDPLHPEQLLLLQKRVKDYLSLKTKPIKKIFVYHHRSNNGFSEDVKGFLFKAYDLFIQKYTNIFFICFTQVIIDKIEERGINKIKPFENMVLINFMTLEQWGGNNPEIFWARVDNDLITEAFNDVLGFS